MANNGGNIFLLTAKFVKSANNAAILPPNNHKLEGKEDIYLEGAAVNNK